MKPPITAFILLASIWAFAAPAVAAGPVYEMEYTNEEPLMVIRFNQRTVMYERPLYNTIARALEVKPQATFDIVSVAPRASSSSGQKHNDQLASQNTGRVLATLREIGLPQSRINLVNTSDSVNYSEVRIFVR